MGGLIRVQNPGLGITLVGAFQISRLGLNPNLRFFVTTMGQLAKAEDKTQGSIFLILRLGRLLNGKQRNTD